MSSIRDLEYVVGPWWLVSLSHLSRSQGGMEDHINVSEKLHRFFDGPHVKDITGP